MARTNSRKASRGRGKRSIFRRILLFLLTVTILAICVGGLLLSGYLIKLDDEIRARFAGTRWALPAQVFSAPLDLYPGRDISSDALQRELKRLGYRPTDKLAGPGTFSANGKDLTAHVRAFQFWDGPQPEAKIGVKFSSFGIAAIRDLEADEARDIVRLDPMLIGSIYPTRQGEDRVLLRLEEIPPLLRDGLLAVEDAGFYDHFGISLRGIARAAVANVKAGRVVQGASTITQQLVKNFFLSSRRDMQRKAKEALMALLLEAHYSKDEILEAYFNEVHLGQDGNRAVHGFGLGSRFYFNKPVSELRVHEIALLIGVVKGSSHYNPRRNPKNATARRAVVLGVLKKRGLITEEQYEEALAQPLGVAGGTKGTVERYPAFVDLVKRQLTGQYKEEDIVNEGLRIFTTLEPHTQELLEKNLSEGVDKLEKDHKKEANSLQTAGVITSVNGGEVLAVVGGRNFRYAGFNRALDSKRSIGSLVKPFVYLSALTQFPDRYQLQTVLEDAPIEVPLANRKVWRPKNYDKRLHGPQPLYRALAKSYNLPTVRIGMDAGVDNVIKALKASGYSGDAQPLPSVLLGAIDISPIEVAQMYGTLAAGGFQSQLSAIRSVTTKEGTPLNRYPIKVRQTLPEGQTYLINWALTQVIRIGTSRHALSAVPAGAELAGKTGTTDDLRDSWFAGFGADLVSVIWMGRDDYKSMGFTGSSGSLRLWTQLMKDLKVRGLDMIPPSDVEMQLTDTFTGLKADEGCADAILIPYLRGRAPQNYAPCANAAAPTTLDWLREMFE